MSKRSVPLTVLVIEDEPLIRWALLETISEAGHDVVEAPDAAGGIRTVVTAPRPFALIFLDFRLPDSSDFGLLTAIRTAAPGSAVVLMTASDTPEMLAEARQLGVARVLRKPFDLVEVRHIVTAVSLKSRGDDHGTTRHQRVPVPVPMDFLGNGNATGTVDLRHLPAAS